MKDFIQKKTPSDALPVLKLAVILFTFLVLILVFWASIGNEFSDVLLLPVVVASYAIANLSYSLLGTLLYRNRKRLAKEANGDGSKLKHSYGELVGAGFIVLLFTLGLFSGLKIWHFSIMPESAFVAIEVTVGIIAAASIAKIMALPEVLRSRHNGVLYFLSIFTTVIFIILLTNTGLGGEKVDNNYIWAYMAILASYALHNTVFSILRPGKAQKRHGHLIAGGVVLFTFIIYVLTALNITVLPRQLFPFFAITMIILSFGAGAKFLIKEPLIRKIFGESAGEAQEHLEKEHTDKNIKNCVECNGSKE